MSKDKIQLIIAMLPLLTELTLQLIDLVERLQDEGYEVPSIGKLRAINQRLKELSDLGSDSI